MCGKKNQQYHFDDLKQNTEMGVGMKETTDFFTIA